MIKRVGVFAHTNDSPSLETGVTRFNIELISNLCIIYPDLMFYIYVAENNSKNFTSLSFSNLKIVKLNNIYNKKKTSIQKKIMSFVFEILNPMFKNIDLYKEFQKHPINDIYIYTVYGLFQEMPIYINSKLHRPCISIIHDIRYIYENEKVINLNLYKFLNNLKFKKILNNSNLILVPSLVSRNKIIQIFGDYNIKIAYCVPKIMFSDINLHSNSYDILIKSKLITSRFIYYPATVIETKNHKILIRAFKQVLSNFENLKLVFSGTKWDSELGIEIIDLIKILDLNNNVIILNYISEDLKYSLIKNALCVCIPSHFESFNLAIWEAFALSTPVICSNDEELIEQVNNSAIIFNQNDINDLSKKIELLLTDQSIINKYKSLGNKRYLNVKDTSLLNEWTSILN